MRTKIVKSIPDVKYFDCVDKEKNAVQSMLARFNRLRSKYMQVFYDEGEYATITNCIRAIHAGIKLGGFHMKVHRRGNDIYIEKL